MSKSKSYLSTKIKNPKGPLIISVVAALAIDFVVFLTLILSGHNLRTLALPFAAMVLDALFLIVACMSNFRFKYSIAYFSVYSVAIIGLAAGTAATFISDTIVMSIFAAVMWLGCHAAVVLFSLYLKKYASKRLHSAAAVQSILALVFAMVTLFIAVAYGLYVGSNGFFGQGRERPISYVYDSESDSYFAEDVFEGGEDTLIIPEKFNGKPVSKVSGRLLGAEGIKIVRFETSDFEFVDLEELGSAQGYRIEAQKQLIDGIKKKLYDDGVKYQYTSGNVTDKCFAIANAMTPIGLEDGEKYITFKYSAESYNLLNGDIIPTWYGKDGDTFKVSDIKEIETFSRRNSLDDNDLDWNFNHTDGYIFKEFTVNGEKIDNSAIIENYDGVDVEFEKIYRVTVGESNDYQKYKISDSLKRSVVNGVKKSFKYVTPTHADEFIEAMDVREGFELRWDYEKLTRSNESFDSLSELLTSRAGSDLTIYPKWSMIAPTIDGMTSDNDVTSDTYSVMYGEKLEVTCEATPASKAFSVAYTWKKGKVNKANDETLLISSMPFDGGGAYTVTVKTSSADSDLTATSTFDIDVQVEKRTLNIKWTDPTDRVYSATDKTIGCEIDDSRVINGDAVTWTDNMSSGDFVSKSGSFVVKKSGSYTARVKLSGKDGDKYVIASGEDSHTVTIDRKSLTASWSDLEYTYDAEPHTATVQVSGLHSDDVSARCLQSYTDQGQYSISATLEGSDKDNYEIENNSKKLIINAKSVTLTWSTETITYNGSAQHPTVQSAEELVKGHSVSTLDLTYSGWSNNKNAGNGYTVTATIRNKNYKVAEGGSEQCTYDIAKRQLTLVWSYESITYNATQQHPTVTTYGGVVVADEAGLRTGTTYTVNKGDNYTDVGEDYVVTADIHNENYEVSEPTKSKSYSITQAPITIKWEDLTVTYNGGNQSPRATADGLGTDALGVEISGADKKDVQEGGYRVTATLTGDKAKNYDLQNGTQTFTINKYKITAEWTDLVQEYDNKKLLPKATVTPLKKDNLSVVVTTLLDYSGGPIGVGEYEVAGTLVSRTSSEGNYELTNGQQSNGAPKFKIIPRKIKLTTDIAGSTYDGKGRTFEATGTTGGTRLADGHEITGLGITFPGAEDNVDAKTYTVSAQINDTYKDSYEILDNSFSYTISKRDLTLTWSGESLTYNGTAQAPEVSNANDLADGQDIAVLNITYSDTSANINAGNYSVTATLGDANYQIKDKGASEEHEYSINAKEVTLAWDETPLIYNGKAQYPKVNSATGLENEESLDALGITYSGYENNIAAKAGNEYKATAKLTGKNYRLAEGKDREEHSYSIEAKEITLAWDDTPLTYNGKAQYPKVKDAETLVERENLQTLKIDYSGYDQNIAAKSGYTVTATLGNSNYKFADGSNSEKHTYEIKAQEVTLVWDETPLIYNGRAQAPQVRSVTGLQNSEEMSSLKITYSDHSSNINAKKGYSVTASITNDNYSVSTESATKTYDIGQKAITLKWSEDELTQNGEAQRPTVTGAYGLENGEQVEGLNITYSDTSANITAGSYSVTATLGNSNYTVTDGSNVKEYSILAAE